MLSHAVLAQPAVNAPGRYPAGSIRSVDKAEEALADVAKERAEVEQRFATEKNGCLSRFFTSKCIDDAKERRRAALEQLKAVEVEANAYKRLVRVQERDKALDDRRAQEERDRQDRAQRQSEESVRAPRSSDTPPRSEADEARSREMAADRKARHEAKLQRIEAEEAANAQKRAENAAAYERKVQAAQARQQEIAKKKADKERERAQHQPVSPEGK